VDNGEGSRSTRFRVGIVVAEFHTDLHQSGALEGDRKCAGGGSLDFDAVVLSRTKTPAPSSHLFSRPRRRPAALFRHGSAFTQVPSLRGNGSDQILSLVSARVEEVGRGWPVERKWTSPFVGQGATPNQNPLVAKKVIEKFQRNPKKLGDPTRLLDDSVPTLLIHTLVAFLKTQELS
jgi:hypothetical protein